MGTQNFSFNSDSNNQSQWMILEMNFKNVVKYDE